MSRKTVAYYMKRLVEHYEDTPSLIFKKEFRTQTWSYRELYSHAHKIAGLFKDLGVKKGDKIIIYSYNSPAWGAIFLACALSGVIAVPLDFNSKKEFVLSIAKKVNAKLIFSSQFKPVGFKKKELFVEDVVERAQKYSSYVCKANIKEEDILEIVYTSGTTSEPKGVVITNRNLVSNIRSLRHAMALKKEYVFLSVVPMSHLLEQTVGFFNPLRFGCKIVYTTSRKSSTLKDAMQSEQITSLVGVPILLKTLRDKIEREIEKQGKTNQFKKMSSLASSMPLSVRRLLFKKIISGLSSRLKFFVVGGAPLDEETEKFWNRLGVLVLQGYGLTETSPIMTCSTFKHHKSGTVGRVLPEQEIKLTKNNEILCYGENVTKGYYKNKKATNASIKKGWFHTGDIGEIDSQGYLSIKGRIKNMILTSSGLNVYPEDIEAVLNEHTSVKDSLVLGLKAKKDVVITGVVLLDSHKKISVGKLIKEINEKLPSHQQLQQIIIWGEKDFPRTPSLKIKRKEVINYLSSKKTKKTLEKLSSNKLFELLAKISSSSLKKITLRSVLSTDLAIDSLHRVELLSLIEEEYGVEMEESKITATTTVGMLMKLLKNSTSVAQKVGLSSLNTSSRIKPLRGVVQAIAFGLLRLAYKVDVVGKENLDEVNGPVIFAINHTSHFDSPTLLRAVPFRMKRSIAFAAAQDYFFIKETDSHKSLKKMKLWMLQLFMNIYPFSRGGNIKNSLKLTGKLLDRGTSIAIYPEGTRTLTGDMAPFKTGIGLIGVHMGVPIVPVYIDGLYSILPKGKNFPAFGSSTVTFGKRILVEKDSSYLKVTAQIEKAVNDLRNSK